jgi:hypothetical protein
MEMLTKSFKILIPLMAQRLSHHHSDFDPYQWISKGEAMAANPPPTSLAADAHQFDLDFTELLNTLHSPTKQDSTHQQLPPKQHYSLQQETDHDTPMEGIVQNEIDLNQLQLLWESGDLILDKHSAESRNSDVSEIESTNIDTTQNASLRGEAGNPGPRNSSIKGSTIPTTGPTTSSTLSNLWMNQLYSQETQFAAFMSPFVDMGNLMINDDEAVCLSGVDFKKVLY